MLTVGTFMDLFESKTIVYVLLNTSVVQRFSTGIAKIKVLECMHKCVCVCMCVCVCVYVCVCVCVCMCVCVCVCINFVP